MADLTDIALEFARLGLLSFGGGLPVLAEMERTVVVEHGWVTGEEFWGAFALGQLTPGPGLLFTVALGYWIGPEHSLVVAAVAGAAFLLPPAIIALVAFAVWRNVRQSPVPAAIAAALRPVIVGLIATGFVSVARGSWVDPISIAGASLCIAAMLHPRISPAVVVLAAGVVGAVGATLRA